MFLTFHTIEEMRTYGGSFLEIQYCSLPLETADADKACYFQFRELTSLYIHIDALEKFYAEYKDIFLNGLYNNLSYGPMDTCGINYYNQTETLAIIERLKHQKPHQYEILLKWLSNDCLTNGFYIYGI